MAPKPDDPIDVSEAVDDAPNENAGAGADTDGVLEVAGGEKPKLVEGLDVVVEPNAAEDVAVEAALVAPKVKLGVLSFEGAVEAPNVTPGFVSIVETCAGTPKLTAGLVSGVEDFGATPNVKPDDEVVVFFSSGFLASAEAPKVKPGEAVEAEPAREPKEPKATPAGLFSDFLSSGLLFPNEDDEVEAPPKEKLGFDDILGAGSGEAPNANAGTAGDVSFEETGATRFFEGRSTSVADAFASAGAAGNTPNENPPDGFELESSAFRFDGFDSPTVDDVAVVAVKLKLDGAGDVDALDGALNVNAGTGAFAESPSFGGEVISFVGALNVKDSFSVALLESFAGFPKLNPAGFVSAADCSSGCFVEVVTPKEKPEVEGAEASFDLPLNVATPKLKPAVAGVDSLFGWSLAATTPKEKPEVVVAACSFGFSLEAATPKLKPLAAETCVESTFAGVTPNENPLVEELSELLASVAAPDTTPKLNSLGLEEVDVEVGASAATDVPLGLVVSQHGHFASLTSLITEQVGHFQVPGAVCINFASGFEEFIAVGLAVSQHGHLGCESLFVTEHVGHFHVPGAACIKRARGLELSVLDDMGVLTTFG